MLTIGALELGTTPRIAAVVDRVVPLEDLKDLRLKGVDLLEIRADLFDKPLDCITRYVKDCRSHVGLPMIGTVRVTERTRDNRLEIFGKLVPFVDCVDVELGAQDAAEISGLAKGKVVLVSEHDFETTPDEKGLQTVVDRAMMQGADIVKVVTMANSADDAWRLLRFAKTCMAPIVAFAMGVEGAFSRVRACEFGSLFTYGHISGAVAPGQFSAEELVKMVKGENKIS